MLGRSLLRVSLLQKVLDELLLVRGRSVDRRSSGLLTSLELEGSDTGTQSGKSSQSNLKLVIHVHLPLA